MKHRPSQAHAARPDRPRSLPAGGLLASVVGGWGVAGLLVACAATPPPPSAPVLAPLAEPSAPIEIASDPRAVRCGVDDQPRSVVSALSDEEQTFAFAEAARRQARVVMVPPHARRPMPRPRPIPVPRPVPTPQMPLPSPPPPPTLEDRAEPPAFVEQPIRIEARPRGVPTVGPGGSSRAVAASLEDLRPALAECTQLLDAPPGVGTFSFDIRLSATGQALVITPEGTAQPSVYERCLLEHACRLHTPALVSASNVVFDVRTFRDEPASPPPGIEQNPHIGVDVRLDVDPRGPGGLAQRAFSQAALACRAVGTIGSGAQIVIRGGAPSNRIQQLTTRGVDGKPPTRDAGIACVVSHLRNSLDGRVASPQIVGTVRWVAR